MCGCLHVCQEKTGGLAGIFKKSPKPAPRSVATKVKPDLFIRPLKLSFTLLRWSWLYESSNSTHLNASQMYFSRIHSVAQRNCPPAGTVWPTLLRWELLHVCGCSWRSEYWAFTIMFCSLHIFECLRSVDHTNKNTKNSREKMNFHKKARFFCLCSFLKSNVWGKRLAER